MPSCCCGFSIDFSPRVGKSDFFPNTSEDNKEGTCQTWLPKSRWHFAKLLWDHLSDQSSQTKSLKCIMLCKCVVQVTWTTQLHLIEHMSTINPNISSKRIIKLCDLCRQESFLAADSKLFNVQFQLSFCVAIVMLPHIDTGACSPQGQDQHLDAHHSSKLELVILAYLRQVLRQEGSEGEKQQMKTLPNTILWRQNKVRAKGFDGSETMKSKWNETVLSRKALRMKENKKEP